MTNIVLAAALFFTPQYETKLLNAIYTQEGGQNTRFPYGIHSKRRLTYPEARQWCKNTIEHAFRDWNKAGAKKDYLDFLGKRYAQDPMWSRKIRKLMNSASDQSAYRF